MRRPRRRTGLPMDMRTFLQHLESDPDYRGQIRSIRMLPEREPVWAELSPPVATPVAQALERMGIQRLYSHQAAALAAVRAGRHVMVTTGTASGKSLAYHIPALEALTASPSATALYLYPTKALAQDQLRFLLRLAESHPQLAQQEALWAGTYDGDTPPDRRRRLRESCRLLLTNPDMLHSGILPHHPAWGRFFQGLSLVAIDEAHVYRGLFGSHVANVIRRLRRVASRWGSSPTFVLCSATVANPDELARSLVGAPVQVVHEDGSPRPRRWLVLWNPPRLGHPPARRSANLEAADLMARLVAGRVPTIAFGRARVVAELLYRYVRERLQRIAPSAASAIYPYRGGYLPEIRRFIEQRLFSGELLGVCSTNALELGIDVGPLDAALLVGFPGSIASFWQQAGRAGRRREGLAVLIAHDAPVDQYLMEHPEYLMERSVEPAALNPDNPQVVLGHLRAAAYELPLSPEEVEQFGTYGPAIMQLLVEAGETLWDGHRWRWRKPGVYPAGQVALRTASAATYTILDAASGRAIGTLDEPSAFFQLHPEAVYLHEGETYLVERLDLVGRVAYVRREVLDYFTQAVAEHRLRPVGHENWTRRRLGRSEAAVGEAVVTQLVYMFKKVRFESRDSLGWGRVELPSTELYTEALALVPDPGALAAVHQAGLSAVEGMWGMANALSGVMPLFVGCDPADVGAVVDPAEGPVPGGGPCLYLYDRHPGGAGFARQAFQRLESIMEAARELVARCPCERGCPSCVGAPALPRAQGDPELESRGRVPDKRAAMRLLAELCHAGGPGEEVAAGSAGWRGPSVPAPPPPAPRPLPPELERQLRRHLSQMTAVATAAPGVATPSPGSGRPQRPW